MARRALLVVDGYNVIYGTTRYQGLIDEHAGAGALARLVGRERRCSQTSLPMRKAPTIP